MKFQGTYLIIFAIAIAAYYIYLGIKILGKKIFMQKSCITDYIIVLILVPLFINTFIVFIKDKLYTYKASWIVLIIIFIITAFYVASVILGLSSDELDIYNASEDDIRKSLEGAAKKMNISFSVKDNKYLFNINDDSEKTTDVEINNYKIPLFVKLTINNFKSVNNYKEFFKEFTDELFLQNGQEKPDKKSYLFYFIGSGLLIIVGIIAIIINMSHLWV